MHLPHWASAAHTRMSQLRGRVATLRSWLEATIFWRVWERLLENEFVDRSVAVAAKAFVSLFPALIVLAAFAPASVRASIMATVSRRAGLSGDGLDTVEGAFASSDDIRQATGVIGLLFTFFYVNSFTTALRRVYTRAWRRPSGGRVSAYALGAAWLAAIIVYFALLGAVRAILGTGPQTLAAVLIAWLAAMALWWLTPWFMLRRQVRLRVLVPVGVLTGTGMTLYGASSTLWMPRIVTENQNQFGFFGVALALVTWLTGAGLIIVAGACASAVLADDEGWLGHRIRGSSTAPVLVPGAVPSLPAPVVTPGLSSAFGMRTDSDEEEAAPDPP
jgi:membrane protein